MSGKSPVRSTQRKLEGVGMRNMEAEHAHFKPESYSQVPRSIKSRACPNFKEVSIDRA